MGRIGLAVIAFIAFFSFFGMRVVFAQTMGEGTEVTSPTSQAQSQGTQTTSQGTNVLQSPPNYPLIDNSGRVYPQEDLNPFGLSTLGSADNEYNTEGSTLGTRAKPRSNLEVNKPREKGEGEAAQETGEETTAGSPEAEVVSEGSEELISPSSLTGNSGLYKWVDKNGVLHVTNDFGSVPPQYQGKVSNEPEKAQEEEPSQP